MVAYARITLTIIRIYPYIGAYIRRSHNTEKIIQNKQTEQNQE